MHELTLSPAKPLRTAILYQLMKEKIKKLKGSESAESVFKEFAERYNYDNHVSVRNLYYKHKRKDPDPAPDLKSGEKHNQHTKKRQINT